MAGREGLDNLVWVVNCNLQRVRRTRPGAMERSSRNWGIFRGRAGNVIKLIWGGNWDDLLARSYGTSGQADGGGGGWRVSEVRGGTGSYIRKHFFGKYPELLPLVNHLTDDQLKKLMRGGHDPRKVYAAYHAATTRAQGRPTVILAKTVKGYGLGEAGEGRNPSHQQKSSMSASSVNFGNASTSRSRMT